MKTELETITREVLSYCEIPEDIAKTCSQLEEVSNDVYVDYEVTCRTDQKKYDDDFTLANWIIKEYPNLEGSKIFIHIDY